MAINFGRKINKKGEAAVNDHDTGSNTKTQTAKRHLDMKATAKNIGGEVKSRVKDAGKNVTATAAVVGHAVRSATDMAEINCRAKVAKTVDEVKQKRDNLKYRRWAHTPPRPTPAPKTQVK